MPNQCLELSILKDTSRMYHEAEGALWFLFHFITQLCIFHKHHLCLFASALLFITMIIQTVPVFHISFPNFAWRKTTENIRRGNVNDLYSYWFFHYLETCIY